MIAVVTDNPDRSPRYRLAEEVICGNLQARLLAGEIVGFVCCRCDSKFRQLVAADSDFRRISSLIVFQLHANRIWAGSGLCRNLPIGAGDAEAGGPGFLFKLGLAIVIFY